MLDVMASPKPKPPAKSPEPEGRRKSKLTQIGDEAKKGAMRDALLAELKRQQWNLTRAAEALEMAGPSAVITALRDLDLGDEYEAARSRGDIAPGRPK